MQDKQHADTKTNLESMPATPAATPTKPRGRVVTFFAKMYSPHGTLTCKEFIWPAVYLLTLGRLFDALMFIPLDILNVISPIQEFSFLGKAFIILYAVGLHIFIFAYPLLNIYKKFLKATSFNGVYYNSTLCLVYIFIYNHSVLLEQDTFLYYSSGYILCVALTLSVYIMGKKFRIKNEDAAL